MKEGFTGLTQQTDYLADRSFDPLWSVVLAKIVLDWQARIHKHKNIDMKITATESILCGDLSYYVVMSSI